MKLGGRNDTQALQGRHRLVREALQPAACREVVHRRDIAHKASQGRKQLDSPRRQAREESHRPAVGGMNRVDIG